ncbi:MAG: hypothetical protein AAFO58_01430, partial [Pseudomonadota bacterium]
MMRALFKRSPLLRRFVRDSEGVASVETILLLPLLMWAYVSTFVFFDAYRVQTDGLRVAYSVSDSIGRQENGVNQTFMNSMERMTNFLTKSPNGITLRTTIVCWSNNHSKYRVAWSNVTGAKTTILPHTHHTLHAQADRLPVVPFGDQLILVEMFLDYRPAINV